MKSGGSKAPGPTDGEAKSKEMSPEEQQKAKKAAHARYMRFSRSLSSPALTSSGVSGILGCACFLSPSKLEIF